VGPVRCGVVCGIRGAMFDGWSRGLRGGVRLVYVGRCVFFGSMRDLCVPVVPVSILRGSLRV
jgi:hypothetical protein